MSVGPKIEVRADGHQALGVFKSIERGAHHLSGEISSGIKGAIVESFAVGAILEAAKQVVEFADATVKGAEALDVTTDNFQALKIAAREAGKDMSMFEKSFIAIDKAASMALGGDSKAHKAFQNLGISQEDIKNLNKVALLQKIMSGTQGQSRNEAVGNLQALGVRGKDANGLMAIQPQLADLKGFVDDLKTNGQIATNEDLTNLAELKDKWEDMKDSIITNAIPALTWFLDALMTFGHKMKQAVQFVGAIIGAFIANLPNVNAKGLAIDMGRAMLDPIGAATGLLVGNALPHALNKEGNASFTETIQDTLKGFADEDAKIAADEAARKKRREEEQAAHDAPAQRKATVKGNEKTLLDSDLKGDAGLVKIGGLGGIDTAYRLERLSKKANEYLQKIVENTTPPTNDGTNEFGD